MIRFELVKAPAKVRLLLTPFLAFRDIHALTDENPNARTDGWEIPNGMSFNLYDGFPDLNMQFNTKDVSFVTTPCWYKGVTYSDEYRRGFASQGGSLCPGTFRDRDEAGRHDSVLRVGRSDDPVRA